MSRPSVRRAEVDRKKDVTLMWMIEWLKDVSASLDVMIDLTVAGGTTVEHYEAALHETQTKVDKIIERMEEEPA